MAYVVRVSPHRKCSFGRPKLPWLLYTDASDIPNREPRFVIGGVLVQQDPVFSIEYFSTPVPDAVVAKWLPKQTFMGQLEVLAAPVALATWRTPLTSSQVIHFIDNDAAAAALVRGYSPKSDSTVMVGEYWTIAAACAIDTYVDRVESKSNLSDGPSRLDLRDMEELNARPVQAVFPNSSSEVFKIFSGEDAAYPLVQSR
eukprot:s2430_g9.t2